MSGFEIPEVFRRETALIPEFPENLPLPLNKMIHCFIANIAKKNFLSRYQNFWLPFAARHTDRVLVAPLDLELVWVAHMLNHDAYVKDCEDIGAPCVIPHWHSSYEDRKAGVEETKVLWEMTFNDQVS